MALWTLLCNSLVRQTFRHSFAMLKPECNRHWLCASLRFHHNLLENVNQHSYVKQDLIVTIQFHWKLIHDNDFSPSPILNVNILLVEGYGKAAQAWKKVQRIRAIACPTNILQFIWAGSISCFQLDKQVVISSCQRLTWYVKLSILITMQILVVLNFSWVVVMLPDRKGEGKGFLSLTPCTSSTMSRF